MAEEQFVLDGLYLNGSGLVIEEFDFPTPKKRLEWAQGSDADGSVLVRDPLFENREGTLKLRVTPKATMLLASQAVAGISRKLEECELNPGGLPLVWTPADGTVAAVTFYVLTGQITDMPMSQVGESGYFVKAPLLTVALTCKPFAYGTETVLSTVSDTAPFVTVTIPDVPGDVPAEGRLVVTDGSSKDRRFVEWGLEQRNYNAATSLLVDSDSFITSGYAAAQTTRTGAYDPNASGNNVVRATLQPSVSAFCGIGSLSHVGTFRVKARVFTSAAGPQLRLSWRDGDGPLRANAYATPATNGSFADVDLGVVSINPAQIGTQQWSGQIEARSATDATLDVDHLVLIPVAEGYGRARGELISLPGVSVAYDTFTTGTMFDPLNARVGEGGGSWATSGGTGDFLYGTGNVTRGTSSTGGTRFAILGSSVTGLVDVAADTFINPALLAEQYAGVVARWADANNYLLVRRRFFGTYSDAATTSLDVIKVVSGTSTVLASVYVGDNGGLRRVGLRAAADGSWSVFFGGTNVASGADTALATGGALANGKAGLYDNNTGFDEGIRVYDNFLVSTAPTSPPALYSGRAMEFRANGDAIRQNAAGTVYGSVPSYRGSRFVIPPAGDKNRTSRVLVKAARNDLLTAADEPLGDSISVQVRYTPRYLVVGA